MKYAILVILFFSLVFPLTLPAEDAETTPPDTEKPDSLPRDEKEEERSDFILEPDVHWIGATLNLGFRGIEIIPGRDTIFWASLGGEVDRRGYYFLPDGTPYTGGTSVEGETGEEYEVDPATDVLFWRGIVRWRMGLAQGLVWNPMQDRNWLEAYAFYTGYYEGYFQNEDADQLLFRSDLPEKGGMFQNSILSGLTIDTVRRDEKDKTYEGYYFGASVEWAPEWFGNDIIGTADYVRINSTIKSFVPIFSTVSDTGKHLFSSYIGLFTAVDYLTGPSIPLHAQQTIGGRYPRVGTGDAVRGVDVGRYSTPFKLVGNLEVRGNLPAFIWPELIPGVLLYFDSGFYHDIIGETYGVLLTTGIGVFMDLFGFGELVVYSQYYINGTNVDGNSITPLNFELGLHF